MSGELHINPSYQGRLFADPDSGAVLRMTRQADDQPPSFPTRRSDTFVAYGPVKVGESTFLLPLRSVTFSEVTGPRMVSQVLPHYPFTRSNVLITSPTDYLNETLYSNYRKFEADSKLVFDAKPETDAITADAAADTRPEPTDAELSVTKPPSESVDSSGVAKTPVDEGSEATVDERETPTFQASAKLVEVSVVARDDQGHLIRDLRQEDFAVYDHGKPQKIRLFKTNESPSPQLPERCSQATKTAKAEQTTSVSNHGIAASQEGAVNVILFDELNTVWTDQVYARNQVIKFLSQMNPKERIGFYLLTPRGPEILQDITTDSSPLVRILAARTSGGQVFPSLTTESHRSDITLGIARWLDGEDHGFKWSQLQASPDPLTAATKASISTVTTSMKMLGAVINHLSGVPGRKNLIWITASFPNFAKED
jgi:VWFA-related protein